MIFCNAFFHTTSHMLSYEYYKYFYNINIFFNVSNNFNFIILKNDKMCILYKSYFNKKLKRKYITTLSFLSIFCYGFSMNNDLFIGDVFICSKCVFHTLFKLEINISLRKIIHSIFHLLKFTHNTKNKESIMSYLECICI